MPLSQRRTRLVKQLHARKTRERARRVLVEGVRAVSEALDAGARVDFVVRAHGLRGGELDGRLSGLDVHTVDPALLAELADTEQPQGIVAVCHEPEHGVDDVPSEGRVLVLDGVQDPGNVGTLIRSAVAFGFDAVLALDGTVDPWGAKAIRASTAMAFRLPVVRCTVPEAVEALRARSIPLLVASAEGRPLDGALSTCALVVGNEGAGVRAGLTEAADRIVAVHMRGPAESINVGIAGSILMHELTREQR